MSKIAYFLVTFIGAVPAGGTLYLLIKNFLDRADDLGGVLLGVTITAAVCCTLVALTPFMVLVFYKDTRPKPPPRKKGGDADDEGNADDSVDEEPAGFGDVIPDDFDEEELSASANDDEYDDGAFDDDDEYGGFDDDEYDFDDE